MIRESLKTLETMEGLLAKQMNIQSGSNFAKLFDNIDTMMSQWKTNVERHSKSLGNF